jgi:hypothetical protein
MQKHLLSHSRMALFVILLSGCAVRLSDRGSRLNSIRAEEAKNYEYVGIVEGSSSLAGMARHTRYRNALNELLDDAAEWEQIFVVIDKPAPLDIGQ